MAGFMNSSSGVVTLHEWLFPELSRSKLPGDSLLGLHLRLRVEDETLLTWRSRLKPPLDFFSKLKYMDWWAAPEYHAIPRILETRFNIWFLQPKQIRIDD
jgi:hypothetical protein